MKELTREQQKIIAFISEKQSQGQTPTVREIALHFGYKSPNSANQHLRLIEQKGYIKRHPGKSRNVEIISTSNNLSAGKVIHVPLVGTIAAGAPILATENIEEQIALDADLFKGDNLFSLRVKGDSMKGIGILSGDIAIIRKQDSVPSGEVAAIIIEGEATLKRIIYDGSTMTLRPENPEFRDITVTPDMQIQIAGKLAGVIRKC